MADETKSKSIHTVTLPAGAATKSFHVDQQGKLTIDNKRLTEAVNNSLKGNVGANALDKAAVRVSVGVDF